MGNPIPSGRVADDVLGVVIAGGRSVRFGGEKAAAELAGKPLLLWAAGRLQRSCRMVAVNARAGTEAEAIARAAGFTVLHDEPGDAAGPLAGVKVGLIWAMEQGAHSIAVSPCDVPMLPVDLFPKLLGAASGGAAMAETDEGHQPQCAVWPVSALPQLREALADGQHPATWMMLQKIGAQRVRFANAQDFMNINTRIDLAMLANRLALQATTGPIVSPDDGTPPYQR
jgi:molybdopterin-guanine dinucleotide biosynthesis protein A